MKIFHFYLQVFVEFTIIVIFVYHQFIIVSCCFIVLKMSKKQVQEIKCVFIHVLIIPFIIFYRVINLKVGKVLSLHFYIHQVYGLGLFFS